jgi:hypothetical protein
MQDPTYLFQEAPDFWIGEGPTSFQKPEQLVHLTPMHLDGAFVGATCSPE